MAIGHDIKSKQAGLWMETVQFTPLTGSGHNGVTGVSGGLGMTVRHHSASDAVPYPGVFSITFREDYVKPVGGFAHFSPSSSLEGTGSNGMPFPRNTVIAQLKLPPNYEKSNTVYVHLIQTSGSGHLMTKDHAHDGKAGRPVDVSGTAHDRISVSLWFSNTKHNI